MDDLTQMIQSSLEGYQDELAQQARDRAKARAIRDRVLSVKFGWYPVTEREMVAYYISSSNQIWVMQPVAQTFDNHHPMIFDRGQWHVGRVGEQPTPFMTTAKAKRAVLSAVSTWIIKNG